MIEQMFRIFSILHFMIVQLHFFIGKVGWMMLLKLTKPMVGENLQENKALLII